MMNSNFHEDNWYDVVSKAATGLRVELKDPGLADLDENNPPTDAILSSLAENLNLDARSLSALAKSPAPTQVAVPENLIIFTSKWHSMLVNAYLIILNSGKAILFDTGTDGQGIKNYLKEHDLELEHIFITHTHKDHIASLDELSSLVPEGNTWSSENEYYDGTTPFKPGKKWQIDTLSIESRMSNGHSVGGTTFVLSFDSSPPSIAIVGDAIFARSMGGGKVDYQSAIETNISQILTLPESCLLCPGHGALTTVGLEKSHNPFLVPHV